MLVRFSVFNTLPTFGIIKRILFLEHLYEKIVSDTEILLSRKFDLSFLCAKSIIRHVEAVSNPEMMPGL